MRHRLGLATGTQSQISVCKSPFPSAGTAVSMEQMRIVNNRPEHYTMFTTVHHNTGEMTGRTWFTTAVDRGRVEQISIFAHSLLTKPNWLHPHPEDI